MEITSYKGIIIVDNFITSEENDVLVSLIDKPACYETDTYHKFIYSENKVTPFSLYIQNDKYYSSVVENCYSPIIDNTCIDIKKRICNLLDTKLKVEYCNIEKYSTQVPYTCERELPLSGTSLGEPSEVEDNHSNFIKLKEDWGLTPHGGNRLYCARLFINNDFEGGSLTFPQHKFDIKPVRNRLVLYPCNKNYIYGIRKINGSSFYFNYWFTKF